MITNVEITHYSKRNGYAKQSYDAYVEENYTSSSSKQGEKSKHALFVSIPTEEKLNFCAGDFVLTGKVNDTIDSTTEENESKSIKSLKKQHQIFTITEVTPCFCGSKAVWHYELGCD